MQWTQNHPLPPLPCAPCWHTARTKVSPVPSILPTSIPYRTIPPLSIQSFTLHYILLLVIPFCIKQRFCQLSQLRCLSFSYSWTNNLPKCCPNPLLSFSIHPLCHLGLPPLSLLLCSGHFSTTRKGGRKGEKGEGRVHDRFRPGERVDCLPFFLLPLWGQYWG